MTRAETTLPAVRLGLDYLRPGGLLLLVSYYIRVTAGGAVEALTLREFACGLPPGKWQVTEYQSHAQGCGNNFMAALAASGSVFRQFSSTVPSAS